MSLRSRARSAASDGFERRAKAEVGALPPLLLAALEKPQRLGSAVLNRPPP
jgi:hypothetical protein